MPLAKAQLVNVETGKSYPVMFNPTEYSFSRTSQLSGSGMNVQFNRVGSDDFTVELIFDSYEAQADVRQSTNLGTIVGLINPTVEKSQNKRPPECQFSYGKAFTYTGVVKKAEQRFTLFLEDGTPARAHLTLTIQEVLSAEEAAANAGIEACRKLWPVRAGDRLDLIAAEAMGDARRWPEIAALNNIENPLHFPAAFVGQTLGIPD